ncbi:MAG TPA: hypothetical protein VK646_08355 [Actinomycetota bacterium]|nr:hypothetical protein [Actinomycetota bacterium]
MADAPAKVHHVPVGDVIKIPIGGDPNDEPPASEAPTSGSPTSPAPSRPAKAVPQVDIAEQATKAAVGLAALAVESGVVIIRRISGASVADDEAAEPEGVGLFAGAALGFALEAGRTAAAAADAARRTLLPPASFVAGTFLDAPRRASQERIAQLNEVWRAERPEVQLLAQAVAVEVVQRMLEAVLDQIDLTQIVIDRVDINRVIGSVDFVGVVEQIDMGSIVEHVDVDEIVDRLNVERVIARLDMPRLALEVIDQIDLPEIIRASTGSVASESVRVVRMQSFGADRAISRVVDKLLGRGDASEAGAPPADDADPPASAGADGSS